MNLEQIATNFGLPGLLVLVWYLLERARIERLGKSEDAKTAAMSEGFKSLSGKVDAHHTADIQSHAALGEGIAEIRGMLGPTTPATNDTPARGVRIVRPSTQGDR